MITKCDYCHKQINKYLYEIKQNKHVFCSKICFSKFYTKNGEKQYCSYCNKVIYRKRKSKSGKYFCSKECQNKAYREHILKPGPKQTIKQDKKIKYEKHKLYLYSLNRVCKVCGHKIENKNKTGYCRKCLNTNGKFLLSNKTKELMKQGKIKPWQTRNLLSYPERFFKKILDLNNIKYEGPNYSILQSSLGIKDCIPQACYFLDFKINNIDLEIDGKQHLYQDRIKKDKIRDYYLSKNGYIVYRIQWKSINTEEGKKYIKYEIDKLLNFLKSPSGVPNSI